MLTAQMRIDMLVAYLDSRTVRELALAVSRGEATPPTSDRGVGREPVWAKVMVDNHIAPRITVRQKRAKVDLAALA
jgi:HD-like signal output (HDOD) protein